MASHKMAKKMPPAVTFPKCPVCQRVMAPPIYICQTGHSVCGACTEQLRPPNCPVCQQPMTQMRNRSLEDFINKAKVPCPHRGTGCQLTPEYATVGDHAQECFYRTAECPFAAGLGKCSWTGVHNHVTEHVKEMHTSMFTEGLEAEIEMEGLTMRDCDRRVHVAAQQRNVFVVTFKLDSIQRLAYWTIQYMGPKKYAHNYNYEIHVTSKREPHRKVIFTERCLSDTTKTEDIFRQCLCAVLSLNALETFSTDNKVSYRFVISRHNPNYKPKRLSGEGTHVNTRSPPQRQWSRSRQGQWMERSGQE
ncbi:E3 ubiquitin-protein ligase SIAH1-like [Choristoneura fumiferana]|uniref:E3 ubiquitin-protein ligase SIAH1-like n=1 Tax=Choristoneura fumiferana TaxID=7141 RepID=UPI003D1585A4